MGQPIYYSSQYKCSDLKNACRRYLDYYPLNIMTDGEFLSVVKSAMIRFANRVNEMGLSDYVVTLGDYVVYDNSSGKQVNNWYLFGPTPLLSSNMVLWLEKSYVSEIRFIDSSIVYPTSFVIYPVEPEEFEYIVSSDAYDSNTGIAAVAGQNLARFALKLNSNKVPSTVRANMILIRGLYLPTGMNSVLDIKDDKFSILVAYVIQDICDMYKIQLPKNVFRVLERWDYELR